MSSIVSINRQKQMTHSFRLSIYLDFTDFIDLYIGRYICCSVHPKMKTDFIQTVNLLTIELQLRVELRIKQFIVIFFFGFPLEPGLKSSLMADIGQVGKCPVRHDKICHRFKITSIPPVHSYFPEQPIYKNRNR